MFQVLLAQRQGLLQSVRIPVGARQVVDEFQRIGMFRTEYPTMGLGNILQQFQCLVLSSDARIGIREVDGGMKRRGTLGSGETPPVVPDLLQQGDGLVEAILALIESRQGHHGDQAPPR